MFKFDAAFREEFRAHWLLLSIAFSCLLFGLSAPAFALPFMFPEVIKEFGWTREQATLIASVKWVAGAFSAIIVGRFVDKTGAWVALLITISIGGTAMLSFLWISSLPSYYLSGLLLGFAGPGAMVAVKVLISRTFHTSQGTAMGITLQGTNLGAVIVPILITYLVSAFGWRSGMAMLSMGIWVIALPLLLVGYFSPRTSFGRRAPILSASAQAGLPRAAGTDGPRVRDVMKTGNFWLIAGAVFIGGVVDSAFIQHQVLIFQDMKLSKESIALGISAIGLVGIFGRVLVGNILDGSSNKGLAYLYVSLTLSSLLAFFLDNAVAFVLFVALRAIGHATVLLDTTVMAKHSYGMHNLGTLLGIFTACTGIGFALGPWAMGRLHDYSGSYELAFILLAALPFMAAIMAWFIRPTFWLGLRGKAKGKTEVTA